MKTRSSMILIGLIGMLVLMPVRPVSAQIGGPQTTVDASVGFAGVWSAAQPQPGAPNVDDQTHTWTGTVFIIWGKNSANNKMTGGLYNPATNIWTPMSTLNAPSPRDTFTSIWTGSEMIVYGGFDYSVYVSFSDGARYNPVTNTWTPMSKVNAPSVGTGPRVIWTGHEVLIYGGLMPDFCIPSGAGGRYNPATDTWAAISASPNAWDMCGMASVWTGTEFIVWGGYERGMGTYNQGARYTLSTDTWTRTSMVNAPSARGNACGYWTGSEMIIWGCVNALIDGGRYNPATDTWVSMPTANSPVYPGGSGFWTGSGLIVWGGDDDGATYINSGAYYNKASNTWTTMSTTNSPALPGAILRWTGRELIVWGGKDGSNYLNTGAYYNPASNTWTPMSTANAPSSQDVYAADWIGSEMLVWKKHYDNSSDVFSYDIARYNLPRIYLPLVIK